VLGTGIALALGHPHGPLAFVRVDELRHHRGEELKLHGFVQAIEGTTGDVTRIRLGENGAEVIVEARRSPTPCASAPRWSRAAASTATSSLRARSSRSARTPTRRPTVRCPQRAFATDTGDRLRQPLARGAA
jgi:hypothetical protein